MRVLIAGIGNVFLSDDGFGVEVVRRLGERPLGDGVDVADFGIRGIHLAYELAGGEYDAAILIDAVSRGAAPGTLFAIEPDISADCAIPTDAHNLTPDAVIAWTKRIGASIGRIVVIGCEPATLDESMGLSTAVSASVERALAMVQDVLTGLLREAPCV